MWGTHRVLINHPSPDRFIPAGVGNTFIFITKFIKRSVHPRWCGEHSPALALALGSNGSSPLVWGTLVIVDYLIAQWRFIPAGVGNTSSGKTKKENLTVHPRWCGEHGFRNCSFPFKYGSSPLVWGTLSSEFFLLVVHRFIPAGVGNTYILKNATIILTVHPRWCGEHI